MRISCGEEVEAAELELGLGFEVGLEDLDSRFDVVAVAEEVERGLLLLPLAAVAEVFWEDATRDGVEVPEERDLEGIVTGALGMSLERK